MTEEQKKTSDTQMAKIVAVAFVIVGGLLYGLVKLLVYLVPEFAG